MERVGNPSRLKLMREIRKKLTWLPIMNNSFDAKQNTKFKLIRESNMTQAQERDNFWIYVGLATVILVGVILMVKASENDKYDPIIEQRNEEIKRMNIRIIK